MQLKIATIGSITTYWAGSLSSPWDSDEGGASVNVCVLAEEVVMGVVIAVATRGEHTTFNHLISSTLYARCVNSWLH